MCTLSGKMIRLIFSLILVFDFSFAIKQEQLPFCKKSDSTTDLCAIFENYNPLIPPKNPQPCLIEPRVVINTIEINEESQVLTLLMELKLRWIDNELNLKSYHSSWFQLNGWHFDEVWNPSVHFEKLIDTKKISEFGKNDNVKSWFHNSTQHVYYDELLEVSFACRLDFNGFPLDDHVCNFEFGTSSFWAQVIQYLPTKIYYQSSTIQNENESFTITSDNFYVKVNQLQPFYMQFAYNRVMSSVQ